MTDRLPDIYAELYAQGVPLEDIARQYNIQPDSVRRMIRLSKQYLNLNDNAQNNAQKAPILNGPLSVPLQLSSNDNPYRKLGTLDGMFNPIPEPVIDEIDEPLTIPYEDCLVISDLHVPYQNPEMLWRACQVAKKFGIQNLAILGDIYDFASISQHPKNQRTAASNTTVRIAGDVLKALCEWFPKTYINNGNHDERLSKRLDDPFDLDLLINASLGRDRHRYDIEVTNRDYMYLGQCWMVGHPSNYSGKGGQTPASYADVYQKHIITAHNHILGMSTSPSGKYLGIDCGHMTSPQYHYYVQRRFNRFTRWQSGFVIIKNGFSQLYSEAFTDWEALGL